MTLLNQYLERLEKIEKSLIKKEVNNQLLEFWKGLVRDSEGRWLKYHTEGIKYFQYGKQSQPDLTSNVHLLLIKAATAQNKAFIHGLMDYSFKNYKKWIIELHQRQTYTKDKPQLLSKIRISQGEHSRIAVDAVVPLARKYNDPYINQGTQILYLPKIDKQALPVDKWQNEKQVFHYYPDPRFLDQYFQVMKEILTEIVTDLSSPSKKSLVKVALYYQYAINPHMFENINQSLFANQMNALLQVFGFRPINHGILDFVAMRLQPDNFIRYFIDEVGII